MWMRRGKLEWNSKRARERVKMKSTCKTTVRWLYNKNVGDAQLEINDSIRVFLFVFDFFLRWVCGCVCVCALYFLFYWIHPKSLLCLSSCHSMPVTLKTISFKLFRRWVFVSFFFFYLFKAKSFIQVIARVCFLLQFVLLLLLLLSLLFPPLLLWVFVFFFLLSHSIWPFGTFNRNEQTNWRDVYSHLQCNIEKIQSP